jgi:hypothetical protein
MQVSSAANRAMALERITQTIVEKIEKNFPTKPSKEKYARAFDAINFTCTKNNLYVESKQIENCIEDFVSFAHTVGDFKRTKRKEEEYKCLPQLKISSSPCIKV